jgi:hypothetical protein
MTSLGLVASTLIHKCVWSSSLLYFLNSFAPSSSCLRHDENAINWTSLTYGLCICPSWWYSFQHLYRHFNYCLDCSFHNFHLFILLMHISSCFVQLLLQLLVLHSQLLAVFHFLHSHNLKFFLHKLELLLQFLISLLFLFPLLSSTTLLHLMTSTLASILTRFHIGASP